MLIIALGIFIKFHLFLDSYKADLNNIPNETFGASQLPECFFDSNYNLDEILQNTVEYFSPFYSTNESPFLESSNQISESSFSEDDVFSHQLEYNEGKQDVDISDAEKKNLRKKSNVLQNNKRSNDGDEKGLLKKKSKSNDLIATVANKVNCEINEEKEHCITTPHAIGNNLLVKELDAEPRIVNIENRNYSSVLFNKDILYQDNLNKERLSFDTSLVKLTSISSHNPISPVYKNVDCGPSNREKLPIIEKHNDPGGQGFSERFIIPSKKVGLDTFVLPKNFSRNFTQQVSFICENILIDEMIIEHRYHFFCRSKSNSPDQNNQSDRITKSPFIEILNYLEKGEYVYINYRISDLPRVFFKLDFKKHSFIKIIDSTIINSHYSFLFIFIAWVKIPKEKCLFFSDLLPTITFEYKNFSFHTDYTKKIIHWSAKIRDFGSSEPQIITDNNLSSLGLLKKTVGNTSKSYSLSINDIIKNQETNSFSKNASSLILCTVGDVFYRLNCHLMKFSGSIDLFCLGEFILEVSEYLKFLESVNLDIKSHVDFTNKDSEMLSLFFALKNNFPILARSLSDLHDIYLRILLEDIINYFDSNCVHR
ncbi:hypothetical protein CDIK_2301 [Cucumispora dikerogammari]|nr:hypothetical protein CDIK_2301 [Cucumispora dikerogammari]